MLWEQHPPARNVAPMDEFESLGLIIGIFVTVTVGALYMIILVHAISPAPLTCERFYKLNLRGQYSCVDESNGITITKEPG